jgi:hypothetical protein
MAARRDDPLFSVLGKLPVVPFGDTGTIPFAMRQHAQDLVCAAFDTGKKSGAIRGPCAGLAKASRSKVGKTVSSHHHTSKTQ